MNPADIKALIQKAGLNQSDIARSLGVSNAMINYAIYDRPGYSAARKEIARILNRPVEELWPSKVPAETAQ